MLLEHPIDDTLICGSCWVFGVLIKKLSKRSVSFYLIYSLMVLAKCISKVDIVFLRKNKRNKDILETVGCKREKKKGKGELQHSRKIFSPIFNSSYHDIYREITML